MIAINRVTIRGALTEAHFSLNIREYRLMEVIISQVNASGTQLLKHYDIPRRDVYQALGILGHGGARESVKIHAANMIKKPIRIRGDEEIILTWFSSIQFLNNDFIRVILDPNMQRFLTGLRRGAKCPGGYGSWRPCFSRFKSSHTARMYILGQRWIYKAITRTYTFPELRRIFGIPAGKYPDFNSFKKNVLKVAKKELKFKADLAFNFFPEANSDTKATTHVKLVFYRIDVVHLDRGPVPIKKLKKEHIPDRVITLNDTPNTRKYDDEHREYVESRKPKNKESFKAWLKGRGWEYFTRGTGGRDIRVIKPVDSIPD